MLKNCMIICLKFMNVKRGLLLFCECFVMEKKIEENDEIEK